MSSTPPLGAIAAYAQAGERMLNRQAPMIVDTVDVLRQISHEALGAGDGIRRIRGLFDRQSGVQSRCHISELIEEIAPMLQMYAHHIRGRIELGDASYVPAVDVDRMRVQHVILALAKNACDASTGSKKPYVCITVTSDRYTVETSIRDSGAGVRDEVQNEIFKPFFTTKPRGTGLGLASSKAIVEAHQGTIGFENLPSGGSRFWFRLPASGK